MKRKRLDLVTALVFLLPNFLGFAVFTAGPVVFSLVASLTNWNLQQTIPFRFNGLQNYVDLVHDKQFGLYCANTVYLMLGMPIAIAGSLFLAVLLNQKLRGLVVYRTLLYLPSFTAGVAIMILWKALLNPEVGPINASIGWAIDHFHIAGLAHALGIGNISPPQWLLSTRNVAGLDVETLRYNKDQLGVGARDALIMMGVWASIGGGNMLLYLAALSNVPEELLEAAQLDGAGRWRCFRSVTWPQLAPTTFFIVVMSMIGGLQGGFEQARVMTNGGPAGTTTTLAYYIYSKAFEEYQIGYASAIAWVLFAIIFGVTVLQWKFGNKEVSY